MLLMDGPPGTTGGAPSHDHLVALSKAFVERHRARVTGILGTCRGAEVWAGVRQSGWWRQASLYSCLLLSAGR